MSRLNKILKTLLILLVAFAAVERAAAQKPSLGVTPAMVVANVTPGKTFVQEYTLANNSADYVRFRCTLGDYWYDENNAPLLAAPNTLERTAAAWIQFTPSEVVAKPRSSVTIKAVISIPETAAGGFYATPFFEGEAVDATGKDARASSSIAVRIGGLMMLATEKKSEYALEIAAAKVAPPTEFSEFELTLDTLNRGNVHAFLKGAFAILDERGKLVGQGRIANHVLMPGQRRAFKENWGGQLLSGEYTVVSTLSYDRAGLTAATLVNETKFKIAN